MKLVATYFVRFFVFIFLFQINISLAQRPVEILTESRKSISFRDCSQQSAGTVNFDPANFHGDSDDISGQVKYLCWNDYYTVMHNGDYDLSGDPVPFTAGSIGYMIFTCEPTSTGADSTSFVDGENCILFSQNGLIQAFWGLEFGDDFDFSNGNTIDSDGDGLVDQSYQELFNNGDPFQWWFAPTTFDTWKNGKGRWEDNGSCINVNVDDAFSFILLNKIEMTNVVAGINEGSFTISGGYPEWDAMGDYTIEIVQEFDANVKATITTTNISNGSLVEFTTSEPGTYDVSISDGKSCDLIQSITVFPSSPIIELEIEKDLFAQPASQICVPITCNYGFDNLTGFQFGIMYDPSVLTFDDKNGAIPTSLVTANPSAGLVTIFWENTSGYSINDGEVLFELCFDVIGSVDDCTNFDFVPTNGNIEFSKLNNNGTGGGVAYSDPAFFSLLGGSLCLGTIDIDFVDVSHACPSNGMPNGSAKIILDKGVAAYSVSYELCDGTGTLFGPFDVSTPDPTDGRYPHVIPSLAPGKYCVTVTDQSMPVLTEYDTLLIEEGPNIIGDISFTLPSCTGDADGMAKVEVAGSAGPFSYLWDPTNESTETIENLSAGITYAVTVTDDYFGCTASFSKLLEDKAPVTILSSELVEPICSGESTGRITISLEGGTAPYILNWGNGETGNLVHAGLPAGSYSVSITDANRCDTIIQNFMLSEPSGINVTINTTTDVTCFDGVPCDGYAEISVIGGNAAIYDFTWNTQPLITENGVATSSANTLCQGFNTVSIYDGSCTYIDSVEIGAPTPIEIDQNNLTIVQPSCFEDTDASIDLLAVGGSSPYTYDWSVGGNTVTGPQITSVGAGAYPLTITDDDGCTTSTIIEIGEPDEFVAMIDGNTRNISCGGLSDGIISISTTGGNVGQNLYTWPPNNQNNLSIQTGLSAGDYQITVEDVKGCTYIVDYEVTEPAVIVAIIDEPLSPACAGLPTTITVKSVSGGSGLGYYFTVDNNPVHNPIGSPSLIQAGEHIVHIFDDSGCSIMDTFDIIEPAPVSVDCGESFVEVELGNSYEINAEFISDFPIGTITWSPNVDLVCAGDSTGNCLNPVVSPVETTIYTLNVTDANGCNASDEIKILIDKDRNVYIPNIFSPNEDGVNDRFSPATGNGVTLVKGITIFDRWGELLYQEKDLLPSERPSYGWDGYFNGKLVQPGVYVYLIEVEFVDGISLLYRGSFNLINPQ